MCWWVWHVHKCDMFMSVACFWVWRIHRCDLLVSVSVHRCFFLGVTCSWVFIRVTSSWACRVYECDVFIRAWPLHKYDVTNWYVRHLSSIYIPPGSLYVCIDVCVCECVFTWHESSTPVATDPLTPAVDTCVVEGGGGRRVVSERVRECSGTTCLCM